MNNFRIRALLAGGTVLIAAVLLAAPGAWAQTVVPPFNATYTLSVFPGTPPAGATQPDDLAISADGRHLCLLCLLRFHIQPRGGGHRQRSPDHLVGSPQLAACLEKH